MVGVVSPDPGRPDSVITTEKPIGSADGAHQVNRWMGITGSRLSKANRHRAGYVGDLGGGDGTQPHIGVAVKAGAGRHPNFPGDPKNGPWPVRPG